MISSLTTYVNECNDNLKKIGISTGNIINVNIINRSVRLFGRCRRMDNNNFNIEVSQFILSDINKLTETIYHELLHTVKGCFNHGIKWKNLANQVNNIYGTNISRTSEATEGVKQEIIRRAKYKITCLNCNQVTYRQKKIKVNNEYNQI